MDLPSFLSGSFDSLASSRHSCHSCHSCPCLPMSLPNLTLDACHLLLSPTPSCPYLFLSLTTFVLHIALNPPFVFCFDTLRHIYHRSNSLLSYSVAPTNICRSLNRNAVRASLRPYNPTTLRSSRRPYTLRRKSTFTPALRTNSTPLIATDDKKKDSSSLGLYDRMDQAGGCR